MKKFEIKINGLSGDYVVKNAEVEKLENCDNLKKNGKFWSFFNKKTSKTAQKSQKQSFVEGFGYISSLESDYAKNQARVFEDTPLLGQVQDYPEPITVRDVSQLLEDLFINLQKLSYLYQQLLGVGERFSNYFKQFIAENTSNQGVLVNIYQLFNEKIPVGQESGEAATGIREGVDKSLEIVQNSIEIAIRINRLVDIDEIFREVSIINATLSAQQMRLLSIKELI